MHRPLAGLMAASALAALSPASAIEPIAPYDNFTLSPLSPDRWLNSERSRTANGATLNVVQRDWGATSSDAGAAKFTFATAMTNPDPVTQIQALVRVNSVEVTGCAANATASQARARIIGSFFSTGNPVPGSLVGDVLVQMNVQRVSNSADPADALRVRATADVCQNSDCSITTSIGVVDNLGTVNVGTFVTLQMEWDKAAKTFRFSRDGGAATGEIVYTQNDSTAPGNPFRRLDTRTAVANCASGPRTTAYIDATFDTVRVNSRGRP